MILLPFFDIPSGFRLGKITEECPFQGPVFFGLTPVVYWSEHVNSELKVMGSNLQTNLLILSAR